jgi:phytoene dehydrogenase-like protein
MTRYDVIVIGAGPAGLVTAGLLAKEGRSVLVLERSTYLGGRGMAVPDEGYKLNLGAHLLEDSGSGITAIMRHLGKSLEHGAVNTEMPVWKDGGWHSVRDFYSGTRDDLKKVVKALLETPYEELDRWDDRPLREWMRQHTSNEGVIGLWENLAFLECLTSQWYDHAASDNLYVRKWHYEEKRVAGYSFWPRRGWDGMFADLRDAVNEHGGEVRMGADVRRVVIENSDVKGVAVARQPRILDTDWETDLIEAPCVVSTLPVWHVLRVVPEQELPGWYVNQIKLLAADENRAAWVGIYIATKEPVYSLSPTELATWSEGPLGGPAGFFYNMTVLEPEVSPPGTSLHVSGSIIPAAHARDVRYVAAAFEKFEQELTLLYPGLAGAMWRRRHLVFDPTYAVLQKPGLVGVFRPHWRAPNVDGLYFASETFRSRGIGVDRAARAGLTVAEDYLGHRIPGLAETWRY